MQRVVAGEIVINQNGTVPLGIENQGKLEGITGDVGVRSNKGAVAIIELQLQGRIPSKLLVEFQSRWDVG